MSRWFMNMALLCALLLACSLAQAQRNIQIAASGDKRVALVIGNDAYAGINRLEKAANDARAMGRALEQVGFRTRSVINGTRTQMNAAINQFVEDVSAGGVGVFFFAGHGVQVANQNFLIPVDMQSITREADIADQSVSLQSVQDKLADAKAKFTLLVIDACRDNPLPKRAGRSLGGTRGLSQASSAEGQMVVFSAGANQQALDKLSDGDANPNGVFTREFLPWVGKPGVTIREAVLGVRSAVRARARSVNHEQFPAIYDQAEGEFYFNPGAALAGSAPAPQAAPPAAPPAPPPTQLALGNSPSASRPAPIQPDDPDTALWRAVEAGNTADDYRAYLQQYPKGKYVVLARQRQQKLQDEAAAAARAAEEAAWQAAENNGTEAGYQSYLATYPRGRYTVLVAARIARLKSDAAVREEAELWNKAQNGSSSDVQTYLGRYPSGRYAAAANQRLVQLKREEAELRPGKVFKDCADCPEMVVIPAGSFMMGGSSGGEAPAHNVTIGKPLALGKTEVTKGQFAAFVNASGYRTEAEQGDGCFGWTGSKFEKQASFNWRNLGFGQTDDHPVACVSWNDAQAYARWLGQKTGKQYRLPSEAEWEYACRAGGRHEYCGSDDVNAVGWYGGYAGNGTSGKNTNPVAQKQANAWGLHDMSGNVWEWVQDGYHDNYKGAPSDGSAWEGVTGQRVLRGGSWYFDPQWLRSANRYRYTPGNRVSSVGLRLARTF